MKYALMSHVEFTTKSNQDTMLQGLKEKIAGKILWADKANPIRLIKTETLQGTPAVNVVLRFENKAERDEVASYIRDKINKIPALNGNIILHKCYHDQGMGHPPCEVESE